MSVFIITMIILFFICIVGILKHLLNITEILQQIRKDNKEISDKMIKIIEIDIEERRQIR